MKDTREFIISKAYKLFLNYSYEAVSISLISGETGLTKGALYHHFRNKEELFAAVVDKHFSTWRTTADYENISLQDFTDLCAEQARHRLNRMISDNQEFQPVNYLSLIADSFRHYPDFTAKWSQNMDLEVTQVKNVIRNAIGKGEIRADINIDVIAAQYFSFSYGIASDLIRNNSVESALQSLKEQMIQLYELLKC